MKLFCARTRKDEPLQRLPDTACSECRRRSNNVLLACTTPKAPDEWASELAAKFFAPRSLGRWLAKKRLTQGLGQDVRTNCSFSGDGAIAVEILAEESLHALVNHHVARPGVECGDF